MKKYLNILLILLLLFQSCSFQKKDSSEEDSINKKNDTLLVDFWSGNRSAIRQDYEREVLKAILEATEKKYGHWKIKETATEYPGDQESKVFSEKQHDLFVTVAGNQKFDEEDVLRVPKPIAKNLLGYRIPIIHSKNAGKLKEALQDNKLRDLVHGIPKTWSDATIFRFNDYKVAEEGDFDDIFQRLDAGNFDYTTFGVNEVVSIYKNRASRFESLMIEKDMMYFYPFPLVFYVNPEEAELAKRINKGLEIIQNNDVLDTIFNRYYEDITNDLNLKNREIIPLKNPLIPDHFSKLKPDLNDFSDGQ